MSNLGSLVVSLEANIAKYTSDMGKAAAIAEQRMAQIDKSIGIVNTSLKAMGAALVVGLTVDKIKAKIEGAIEAAAGLQQLADRTGAVASNLSGLAAVAKLSGTDTDSLATGLQKLSKTMVDAQDGGQKSAAALRAIGIGVNDLKGLKPDEAFLLISKQMDKYADGANKTAIAQGLLGKSGANLLPVMKDLALVGEYQIKLTDEQIALAKQYEDNLRRIEAAQGAVYKVIAMEVLPVMNAFAKAMLESIAGTNGLKKAADDLAKDGSIKEFAIESAKALGFLVDMFDVVARGAMITMKVVGGIRDAWKAASEGQKDNAALGEQIQKRVFGDIDKILMRPQFGDLLAKQLDAMGKTTGEKTKPDPDFKPNSGAADTRKAELDLVLRTVEKFIRTEQQLYQQREQFLQRLYDEDQTSIASYFAKRQQASEDFLVLQLIAYDKEIAALDKYVAQAKDANERIKAQTQIQEVLEKRTQATNAQGAKAEQLAYDLTKAQRTYADSIENLNIKLLQYQDNLDEAAKRLQALQNRQLRKRINAEGDDAAMGILDGLERQETLRTRINTLNGQASLIAERQATAEGRAMLAFNTGATGELSMLRQVGEARLKSIAQIEKIADDMDRVAQASGSEKLIADAEAFRLKLDELRASSDALGKHFTDIFEGSFSSAFGEFISGTKSASDAFQSFANSVVHSINQIVAQDLAKSLFGQGGSSGIGSWLGALLGGSGGGGTKGNNPSAFTAGGSGGGGMFGGIGSWLSGLFGFADGGQPPVGVPSIVGERGPELFVPREAGTIVPNGAMSRRGGDSEGATTIVHVNVTPPQGGNRATASQWGADVGRQIQHALAKNT